METVTISSTYAIGFVSKATEKESILWHRRMSYFLHLKTNYLLKHVLVEGFSLKGFNMTDVCVSCKKRKQKKKAHLLELINSINSPLERLNMSCLVRSM